MNITEDMIDNFCLVYFGSKMDFSGSKTACNQRIRVKAALEAAMGIKNHTSLPDPFDMGWTAPDVGWPIEDEDIPDIVVSGEFQPEDLTLIDLGTGTTIILDHTPMTKKEQEEHMRQSRGQK